MNAQTCIIVYNSDSVVYVGSDSRSFGKSKTKEIIVDTVCKIGYYETIGFAIAGMTPTGLYDKIKQAIINSAGDRVLLGKSVISLLKAEYIIAIKRTSSYIDHFNNEFGSPNVIAKVLLFSVGKNGGDMIIFKVSAIANSNKQFTVRVENELPDRKVFVLGHSSAFSWMSDTQLKTLFVSKGYKAAFNELIQKQSAETPKNVGGKVDIIKMTRIGGGWIARKQNCH